MHFDHKTYMVSDAWKERRDRYYHEHGGVKGYVCAARDCDCRSMLELHHLSYDHAGHGEEPDEELCWLCRDHHQMYHDGRLKITVYPRPGILRELLGLPRPRRVYSGRVPR